MPPYIRFEDWAQGIAGRTVMECVHRRGELDGPAVALVDEADVRESDRVIAEAEYDAFARAAATHNAPFVAAAEALSAEATVASLEGPLADTPEA